MAMEENRIDLKEENAIGADPEEVGEDTPENLPDESELPLMNEAAEQDSACDEGDSLDERREYERLIKTRFKDFYREDAQRMINKRFKKYKELEERSRELETHAEEGRKRLAQLEEELASVAEKVAKETEERVMREIRMRASRPGEAALVPKRGGAQASISSLSRSERARIAKRAANGEKITF